MNDRVEAMLLAWSDLRQEIKDMERAEHLPIIDRYGRVWEWTPGGSRAMYRHCGMAWFQEWILDPGVRLPPRTLADNPNYDMCEICRKDW